MGHTPIGWGAVEGVGVQAPSCHPNQMDYVILIFRISMMLSTDSCVECCFVTDREQWFYSL